MVMKNRWIKSVVAALLFCVVFSQNVFADGTYTVGAGQTYSTLKLAFDAINAGTISGVLVLEVAANSTEAATASLNASGSGSASYSSISIYATGSARTISGALASSLITLNGADNVTIDGRLGGAGAINSLVIENTSTSTSAYTFLLQADASANYIKYCTIKGGTTSTTKGVLHFGTASAGGNDGNYIQNNVFSKASTGYPTNIIFSNGTASQTNSSNSIENNEITDFTVQGLYAYDNTDTWSITGNSFYQNSGSTQFSAITTDVTMMWLFGGSNYTVTGNYFGGQASACSGSAFTISSAYSLHCLNSSATGTNTISSNTIQNINFTTTKAAGLFVCIKTAGASANYTIGSNGNANVIGATSGTDNIIATFNGATSATFYGIWNIATGTVNINYNSFGAITIAGSVPANTSTSLCLINAVGTAATQIITYNTLGNTTLNNISCSIDVSFMGIQLTSASNNQSITNNTLQNFSILGSTSKFSAINMTSTGTGLSVSTNTIGSAIANNMYINRQYVYGINIGTAGTYTISDNYVQNFTVVYSGASAALYGIFGAATTTTMTTMSGNYIQDFTATSLGTSCSYYGINVSGVATITGNFIRRINANAILYGIKSGSGAYATTITSNSITAFTIPSGSLGVFIGIYCPTTSTATVSSNIIGDNVASDFLSLSSSTTACEGIVLASSGTYTCNSNIIRNIELQGTGSKTMYGIDCYSTGTYNLSSNTITNLNITNAGAGSGTIIGVYFYAINASSVVQKTTISGLSTSLTSGGNIYRI